MEQPPKDPKATPKSAPVGSAPSAKANTVGTASKATVSGNKSSSNVRRATAVGNKPTMSGTKATGVGVKKAPAKKKKSGEQTTIMRVGRTLRFGGRTTIDYSRKAMSRFERFVEGEHTSRISGRLRARFTFGSFVIAAVLLLFIALLIFSNRNVIVDQQTITVVGVDQAFEGYRILHLSDLHGRRYGENQASLLRTISNLSYNIVLITGDMVGASGDPEPFYELLEGLGTSRPIYFIAGDSDPGPLIDAARPLGGEATLNQMVLEDWILGAMDRGAIYLNKPYSLEINGATLWLSPVSMVDVNADSALASAQYELDLQRSGLLGGINIDYDTYPFTNYRYRQMMALKSAALYMEDSDLHITLAHYPPQESVLASALNNAVAVENAYLFAPDLALAGHYCGGVWKVPFLGAFYIPNAIYPRHGWFPNQADVNGLRQTASTMVYTSAGLGVTDYGFFPDFRLFNSPQVSLLTLTTTLTEDLLGN